MPQKPTIEEVRQYLIDGIDATSELDESEFATGMRAALVCMHEDLFMTNEERRLARAQHNGGKQ